MSEIKSTGKLCEICSHATPYTDWPRCELCVAVLAIAGKETTADQHTRRALWERRAQVQHLASGTESGRIIASGHEQAAKAYERRAQELTTP